MKCIECGRENLDDAKFCSYCACPLVKEPEITDTGSALRKIYNDFGYEKVLDDPRYITSALGDFVPDTEMISNSIEMAYRAGLGKVYEAQIRKGGKPNEAFYKRVKDLITEDAGLSEKRADKIIGYFDEMLGWKNQDVHESTPASESIVKSVEPEKPAPVDAPKPESKPEITAFEEPVMSEPEDEVLAALADEGIIPEKTDIFANSVPEPDPVEVLSEEDPIRSIPQEQALAELQPEEIEPVKKTEKLFLKIEENKAKSETDSIERKRNAKEKKDVKLAPVVIISLIIIACIAFIIVWTIVIKPSTTQENSNTQSKVVSLSEAEIGSHVLFGSYEQDNDTSNGKEDIEWIVLAREGDRILVISKYALDCQKYDNSFDRVTWETCSLRKWLNETFLNTAFSSEERGKIPVVTVSADKNTIYSTNPGNATTDQVFLLSLKEAISYSSSDSGARECQGTTYCYAKGAYKAGNGNCWWWLRSPGLDSNYAATFTYDGYVNFSGKFVSNDNYAVRPALWIVIDQNNNNESQESSKTQDQTASLSTAKIGSHVIFGSYEQDNDTSNGKEDVEWIVLDRQGDRIFVISKYALDCQPYNTKKQNVTWETCSLRKWLNGTFINTAFSEEERGKIPLVTVTADKNPSYSTNPGNATTDQVFLLSITEANKYFSSDSDRDCKGTTYCYAKGAYKYNNGNCRWWLRSPGYGSRYVTGVHRDGLIHDRGYGVIRTDNAVRPALWIDIGS